MARCPGQDQRFWKPEDIFEVECPACETLVEFWKDEPQVKCPGCKKTIVNPNLDLGCTQWCQYAEECLGVVKISNINTLRNKLIDEMKEIFGDDQKRINHALAVLKYAEQIQKTEGGDPLVVKAAAILHDIGIHEAETKYGSSAGKYQEIEGPPIAREILAKYELDEETIEHICRIIANHHSAKDIDTGEFRCIWDADWLVNIPNEFPQANRDTLQELIHKVFKTCWGHDRAVELFISN